jgi:hypothetical protein
MSHIDIDWLGNVGVRTFVQSARGIRAGAVAASEHDDARVGQRTQVPRQGEAIFIRQTNVEDEHCVVPGKHVAVSLDGAARADGTETGIMQAWPQDFFAQLRIVLDNEDPVPVAVCHFIVPFPGIARSPRAQRAFTTREGEAEPAAVALSPQERPCHRISLGNFSWAAATTGSRSISVDFTYIRVSVPPL